MYEQLMGQGVSPRYLKFGFCNFSNHTGIASILDHWQRINIVFKEQFALAAMIDVSAVTVITFGMRVMTMLASNVVSRLEKACS